MIDCVMVFRHATQNMSFWRRCSQPISWA